MGPLVTLVSSADETAFAVRRRLGEAGLLRDVGGRGVHRFASSGDINVFRELGSRLLGPELDHTESWAATALRCSGQSPQVGSQSMTRPDGRSADELRPITFQRDFTEMAEGSVLVSFGKTRVLCTASVDDDVPRWMRNSGKGWVTAEYSMLPGASPERVNREAAKGKQSGRTVEIQRLIGRSLRASCDMSLLGERQVTVDCDVLQADGGTRTASVCGGFMALHDALQRIVDRGELRQNPLHSFCTAISVGIVDGNPVLDLPYVEDSAAEVDMNVVMLQANISGEPTGDAKFVEVQGTAEGVAFSRPELDAMLGLAEVGLTTIAAMQAELLSTPPTARPPTR